MISLTLTEAPDLTERLESDKSFDFEHVPIRIGRGADNEIILTDPTRTVSRNHARIYLEDNTYVLEDLESKNCTYLNDDRLMPHTPHPLHDGDMIQCGDFVMQVLLEEAEDSTVDLPLGLPAAEFTLIDPRISAPEEPAVEEVNPFEDIVDDFMNLLSQLAATYNATSAENRDAMLAKAVQKSTKGLESSNVVQVIAESLSKTGVLQKELGIPTSDR